MIIQPDFLRHWKTQKLVAMTGNIGSPLALIRLWGHCQTSRKWEFPELASDDLASICEWDSLKIPEISCEKALIACKWIEKLEGGGYRVRSWDEHNKNLIASWKRNPSGRGTCRSDSDPTGTPRAPRHAPDQIRPNQAKSEGPNPTKQTAMARAPVSQGAPGATGGRDFDKSLSGNGMVDGLAIALARGMKPEAANIPTLAQVRNHLSLLFKGAADYAEPFFNAMQKQGWRDKDGRELTSWQAVAKAYASAAALKARS